MNWDGSLVRTHTLLYIHCELGRWCTLHAHISSTRTLGISDGGVRISHIHIRTYIKN